MARLFASHPQDRPFRIMGVLAVLALATGIAAITLPPPARAEARNRTQFSVTRLSNPSRSVVTDARGMWVATFTDGSRTVTLAGPPRTLYEASATNPIRSSIWVRLLPSPFAGPLNEAWLAAALVSSEPDMIAVAMSYLTGAPSVYEGSGVRIAGDADYGPLQPDGTRLAGSDFNDYLGISWSFSERTDTPETDRYGALDCSGFVRMVFGYRLGIPLGLDPGTSAIPRRSYQILQLAPGVVTIPNLGARPSNLSSLTVGDLVFFDASSDDGTRIDHVGIYLGIDAGGHYRFISSRKKANGPTFGDYGGLSLLDGTGLYARSFRAARRL